jgi:hypothetical protein
LPKSKEQKLIFNQKINQAKELFTKLKKNIKDSRTIFNYGFTINNTNNMNSIDKVIRELKLFDKYQGPIIKKDLKIKITR